MAIGTRRRGPAMAIGPGGGIAIGKIKGLGAGQRRAPFKFLRPRKRRSRRSRSDGRINFPSTGSRLRAQDADMATGVSKTTHRRSPLKQKTHSGT